MINACANWLRASVARVKRFASFSTADQRVLLMCALFLPMVWFAIRTRGLGRVQAWIADRPMPTAPRVSHGDALLLAQLVNMAARHSLFPATCLTRSLLLQWLLRRRGVQSDLRIGVRSQGGTLEAHAWIECGGVPVNDEIDVASRFEPARQLVCSAAFQ